MIDLKDKKITVVGLGEKTGISLIRYLSKGGAKVFVSETKKREELLPTWNQVSGIDAEFEFGGHSVERVKGSNLAVICPGVPIDSPFVEAISKLGIEVMSELEFAWRNLPSGKVIAITGTNGKSTTVTMLGEILKSWGKPTFVGGNLGDPLVSSYLSEEKFEYYVIEVSTFQLEGVKNFRPDVGVLLNLSLNHLDRHKTMEKYVSLKVKMFEKQNETDFAVLNWDDIYMRSVKGQIGSKKIFFSLKNKEADLFYENGRIAGKTLGSSGIPLDDFPLKGEHNISNLMAAIGAATVLGCPASAIKNAFKKIKALPHRIELVGECNGAFYYDDSKSTTVDSTIKAIKSFSEEIILISGGRDKGSDFKEMRGSVKERVKAIVLYGEAGPKMESQLTGIVPIYRLIDFGGAVKKAKEVALKGEVVLLSPACASFDQFTSYKERGDRFKKIVRDFINGN